jgi:proteasome lid subunit RPN8/RPN11
VNGRVGAWRVWVSDAAREEMIEAAAATHPSETGGVLAGVVLGRGLGAGRPWVTHAVEVRSRKSGPGHYELPAGARERVVTRLRRRDPRLGYLGDWHSHPADLDPSRTDADSMASASVTGDCRRPLLLVVRRSPDGYEIDARQWTGAALRRLQVRGSGPLLRASDARGLRPHLVTLPRSRREAG